MAGDSGSGSGSSVNDDGLLIVETPSRQAIGGSLCDDDEDAGHASVQCEPCAAEADGTRREIPAISRVDANTGSGDGDRMGGSGASGSGRSADRSAPRVELIDRSTSPIFEGMARALAAKGAPDATRELGDASSEPQLCVTEGNGGEPTVQLDVDLLQSSSSSAGLCEPSTPPRRAPAGRPGNGAGRLGQLLPVPAAARCCSAATQHGARPVDLVATVVDRRAAPEQSRGPRGPSPSPSPERAPVRASLQRVPRSSSPAAAGGAASRRQPSPAPNERPGPNERSGPHERPSLASAGAAGRRQPSPVPAERPSPAGARPGTTRGGVRGFLEVDASRLTSRTAVFAFRKMVAHVEGIVGVRKIVTCDWIWGALDELQITRGLGPEDEAIVTRAVQACRAFGPDDYDVHKLGRMIVESVIPTRVQTPFQRLARQAMVQQYPHLDPERAPQSPPRAAAGGVEASPSAERHAFYGQAPPFCRARGEGGVLEKRIRGLGRATEGKRSPTPPRQSPGS